MCFLMHGKLFIFCLYQFWLHFTCSCCQKEWEIFKNQQLLLVGKRYGIICSACGLKRTQQQQMLHFMRFQCLFQGLFDDPFCFLFHLIFFSSIFFFKREREKKNCIMMTYMSEVKQKLSSLNSAYQFMQFSVCVCVSIHSTNSVCVCLHSTN